MVKEGKTIYRSRIDWWLWAVILLAVAAVIAACIGVQQWYFKWDFLLIMAFLAALFFVTIRGTWYAFADRSVTRSAIPVEISPRDREAFVSQLLAINPGIAISQD